MNNPRVANMLVFLIFLSGIFSMMTLQREELPSIKLDIVKITTEYPGAAPEDVEINVTNRIEDELMEVENIRRLISMSMENLSIIIAEIDPESKNKEKTRRNIRDAVGRVGDLPESVTNEPLVEDLNTSYPVFEISVHGSVPELELRKYAKDLQDRIREIHGVSSIDMIGYRKREISIRTDIKKMKEELVSFNEIVDAIRSRNVRLSGGTVESYVSEKKILTLAEYNNPLDVKNVIVRSNYEGFSVRLSDLAIVTEDFEEPRILYRGNGRPAIALLINKQEGADNIDLSDDISKVLKDFKTAIPESISVEEMYDFSLLTRTMLDIVIKNGILGFILVILTMLLFLEWRSALWSAFGIPFALFGAMVLFAPFGINLNTVALGSMILVIGIVVDDAIVISERIYSLKQTGMEAGEASMNGVKQMILPVSASIVTTILAFLPVLFIPGNMGMFTRQIPIVVTLILLCSLLESVFFIPVHLRGAVPSGHMLKKSRWFEQLKNVYGMVIRKALQSPKRVLLGFIVLLIAGLAVSLVFMKFMLEEDLDPDYFAVVIEAPSGSSLSRTARMVTAVEKLVRETVPSEALKSFSTQIGHHNSSMDIGEAGGRYSNYAMIKVYLLPAAQRETDSGSIMTDLRRKLDVLKSSGNFQRLDVRSLGSAAGKAVEVTYISSDENALKRFEKETLDLLGGIEGVRGIESTNTEGKKELRIIPDYKKMARAGITALDIARTVHTAFDGTIVTSIRGDGEDIDYRLRINNPGNYRDKNILEIPVANREGRLVQLKHIAHLEERSAPAVLYHYGGKRSVTVSADIDSNITTPGKINGILREKMGGKVSKLAGCRMKLGGQEEERALSMKGFFFALIVALISIYFILVVLFNSYFQPLLIMSVIPFAVAGVFLTLIIHGRPLVFISLIGLLGLIGVVVNDTIVMINHLNRESGRKGLSPEIIAEGATDRFRPVVLTTLTTFTGLVPLAYGIGGDLPFIKPMVLSMAWGLVFTTAVTLGFIPVLFMYTRSFRLDFHGITKKYFWREK